jgi:hypothetical protein
MPLNPTERDADKCFGVSYKISMNGVASENVQVGVLRRMCYVECAPSLSPSYSFFSLRQYSGTVHCKDTQPKIRNKYSQKGNCAA